ncbi:MAG: SIMPL domain-containing protein [Chloroflexota bacterium]|nr:SIMPL domain-containing protein [Chloroflexota bacterium]
MTECRQRSWTSNPSLILLIIVLLGTVMISGFGRGTAVIAQGETGTPGPSYQEPSSLSVGGHGSVRLEPDAASIVLGVDIIDTTLSGAQAQATERMNDILEAVTKAGIAEEDVQTVNYSVNLVRDYDNEGRPTQVIEYQVSNQVSIKVRDLDRLGTLLDAVVTAGANNVYGISFVVDDPSEAASQARRLAVQDARAKAEEMAAEVGMRVGRVLTMSESSAPPPPPEVFESRADVQGAAQAVPVQTGTSEVAVDVQITYELLPDSPGAQSDTATPAA